MIVTDEHPSNSHQAQHRPVQATGAMSAKPQYIPDLQRCCGFHPDHPIDTCQGAVHFLTGAEPLGALWALFGSEVEEAAMCMTVISLST